jgi:hypothetical protein
MPAQSAGFFDKLGQAFVAGGFEKLTQQKLWILREAERAGARVLAVWDDGQYEHRSTSARWQALTVGSFRASSVQTFVFETGGVRHLFVQPYSASHPLPGTHHVWLHGALRSPVLFDVASSSFHAGHDWGLPQWLNPSPIGQLLRSIDWTYRIETSTRVDDPLAMQLRAMGDGLGHLVVRASGDNQLHGHDVGFMNVWRIAQVLKMSGLEPLDARQPFLGPEPPGTHEFAELLAGSLELPTAAPVIDASSAIASLLQSLGGKTLLALAPLSAKKEKGARSYEGMVPPWLHGQPILALHDRTVLGGGSQGVALLPTHLCYAYDDVRFVVPYSDITGAQHMIGTLVIRTRLLGDLVFGFPEAERFAALFQHLAAATSQAS